MSALIRWGVYFGMLGGIIAIGWSEPLKTLFLPNVEVEDSAASLTPPPATLDQRILCPNCKGEGGVMVRKLNGGQIEDVRVMCNLCLGRGRRDLTVPRTGEVCRDCEGMGKRLVVQQIAGRNTTRKNALGPQFETLETAPEATSCSRCLGRGYYLKPGVQ